MEESSSAPHPEADATAKRLFGKRAVTRIDHLTENLGGARLELSAADMQQIEAGFQKIGVQGTRFAPEQLAMGDDGTVLGTSSRGGHGKSPLPAERK